MDSLWDLLIKFIKCSLITTGVLFYWRGTWVALDIYLYPDKPEWSAWASMVIGVLGMLIYHGALILHHEMSKEGASGILSAINSCVMFCGRMLPTCGQRRKLCVYLYNFVRTYYFGFIVVNAWRGLWYCQDIYIVFDEFPRLSPWVSHTSGIIVLVILFHFQSVLGPPYGHVPDEIVKMDEKETSIEVLPK